METQLNNFKDSIKVTVLPDDELIENAISHRQSIEKERRVHRRQIWQNRFWFLLAGAAVGVAAGR